MSFVSFFLYFSLFVVACKKKKVAVFPPFFPHYYYFRVFTSKLISVFYKHSSIFITATSLFTSRLFFNKEPYEATSTQKLLTQRVPIARAQNCVAPAFSLVVSSRVFARSKRN